MNDIHNREGQRLELSTLSKVEDWDESYSLTMKDSWSLSVNKSECGDFVPQAGDWILASYEGFNTIAGIIIEGRVLRAKTSAQVRADHAQWKKNYRLEKLERYVTHGEELKNRVKNLHPTLQARMTRLGAEGGTDFWIDSADYEMAVLEGAQALLNKVEELGLSTDKSIQWVKDWWDLNSEKYGYDYKKQMQLVPDFGEGHSGNTAACAYHFALLILDGRDDEL